MIYSFLNDEIMAINKLILSRFDFDFFSVIRLFSNRIDFLILNLKSDKGTLPCSFNPVLLPKAIIQIDFTNL